MGDGIEARELAPFRLPSWEELEEVGVVGIHLGDYLFWDDERQMEFVRDVYGWREDRVEGTYKRYKSVECRMAGVHDYTKFLKRGFGRGTDHASADVRAGLLTREEALRARQARTTRSAPAQLDYYLEITGYSEDEFEAIMAEHRARRRHRGALRRGHRGGAAHPPRGAGRGAPCSLSRGASRPRRRCAAAARAAALGRRAARGLPRPDRRARARRARLGARRSRGSRSRARAPRSTPRWPRGEPVGALAGIPVGVKDIFNTRDMPTQMGSPIWRRLHARQRRARRARAAHGRRVDRRARP